MSLQKTIVFDLDGTLVDSVRDLVPCVNRTIAQEGLAPISQSDIGHIVGQGAKMMIARAYELNNCSLDEATHDRLFTFFLTDYEEHICDHTIFYDGCVDALNKLTKTGWQFAVCTNKFEHLAVNLLAQLGATERFAAITGGDTFDVRKPDPGHILQTIERANGDPQTSVMVGDSENDIFAAQSAGIPSIAVDFGYTDIPVADLKPDRIISHYDELVDCVSGLMPA